MNNNVRLSVKKVLLGAPILFWWHLPAIVRMLAAPVLVLSLLSLLPRVLGAAAVLELYFVISLVYLFGFVIISVFIHRLILQPQGDYKIYRWTTREWRFMGNMFLVYMVFALTVMVLLFFAAGFGLITLPAVGQEPPPEFDSQGLGRQLLLLGLPATYVLARLSLVFPATALGRQLSLGEAWVMSKGNGWRVFIIVGVLPWAFSALISLLLRDNATVFEMFFFQVAGYAVFVLELIALSLCYKELNPAGAKTAGAG